MHTSCYVSIMFFFACMGTVVALYVSLEEDLFNIYVVYMCIHGHTYVCMRVGTSYVCVSVKVYMYVMCMYVCMHASEYVCRYVNVRTFPQQMYVCMP